MLRDNLQLVKRILIVDHEERLVHFLRVSLENLGQGYEVVTASSGQEALRVLEEFPCDVLVAEFRLPDFDGLELIRRVREGNPSILSILMATDGLGEVESRARDVGVYDYFVKPFSIRTLLDRVQEATSVAPEEWAGPELVDLASPQKVEAPSAEELMLSEEAFALEEAEEEGTTPQEVAPLDKVLPPRLTEAIPQEETIRERGSKGVRFLSPGRLEALQSSLTALRFEVGAQCVLLADSLGEVITTVGVTTDVDITTLVSLLAAGSATILEMSRQLGEGSTFNLNFYEGEQYDIYSSNVGEDFLLVIICDRQVTPSKVGLVWLYTKRTIEELHGIMGWEEGSEVQEALGEGFGELLKGELDGLLSEGPKGKGFPPLATDHPLTFEEAKARGLISDDILRGAGEEEEDAFGGEP